MILRLPKPIGFEFSSRRLADRQPGTPTRLYAVGALLVSVAMAFLRFHCKNALLGICLVCLAVAPAYGALRAALLLEHESETPWTRQLRQGLDQAAKRLNLEPEVLILPPGEKQRDLFRQAAAAHDVVLVASDNLHELLRDNAANFRRVMFGSIDAGIRAPNIMSVTFADEQAAFLAGACAATVASARGDPPIIGWLSGADVPAIRSLFNGYREGAMLERPGCRVIQAVVGSFTNPVVAAQKAQWLVDSGARVIALAAGAGNAPAAAIAQKAGAEIITLDAGGAGVLGAIVKDIPGAVEEILAAAVGKFRGKEIVTYDLAQGGVDFLPRVGVNLRRLQELRRELTSGGIRLQSLRQRTLCDCLD